MVCRKSRLEHPQYVFKVLTVCLLETFFAELALRVFISELADPRNVRLLHSFH